MKKNSFFAFLFSLVLALGIGVINCNGVFAAIVGDQLLEAESGWKRYDDTYEAIEYGENVAAANQEGDYKDTLHGVQKTKLGEVARFSFTGDKLRLIGLKSSNYSRKIQIEIDGEIEYFDSNLNSTEINEQFQTIIYSKDDLSYGKHNVIITHISFIENPCNNDFRIDAIDIDKDGELLPYNEDKVPAASVGEYLPEQESGWKRYDDTVDGISFFGEGWKVEHIEGNYLLTTHINVQGKGVGYSFYFKGNEFRIISTLNVDHSPNVKVTIDDKTVNYVEKYNKLIRSALVFEALDLTDGIHKVTVENQNNDCFISFDALDINEDGELLTYNEGVSNSPVVQKRILDIQPEKEVINLNQTVTADVTIDNITEIAAEDMLIKYDSEKLKFLGAEEVEGIKVIKDEETDGQLRVILASQGKDNIANAKKTLLKLNFQGIDVGDALVDITKGKISDGIEMERDLLDEECGQATIIIEDYKDPNKDGEFTLLDLAIDGRYYGLNPVDYPQYKTDVVENGAIDDNDLLQIGQYMMENPNYSF